MLVYVCDELGLEHGTFAQNLLELSPMTICNWKEGWERESICVHRWRRRMKILVNS